MNVNKYSAAIYNNFPIDKNTLHKQIQNIFHFEIIDKTYASPSIPKSNFQQQRDIGL